jgi:transcription-repair coupling factor (superfamily II helicase)
MMPENELWSNSAELGSGFNIAMKDLEIRGAGDLLGGEWFHQ